MEDRQAMPGAPQGRPGLCTDVGRIWTAASCGCKARRVLLSARVITGQALLAVSLSDPVRSGVATAWFWACPHRTPGGREVGLSPQA